MTARVQRDVTDMIRKGGGSEIAFEPGGRHTKVLFVDAQGARQWITFHLGGRPKRYEDCLRSQLRRRGLNL